MSKRLIERDQGVVPTYSYEEEHLAFDFYASQPTDGLQLAVSYSWLPASLEERVLCDELLGWTRYEEEEEELIERLVGGMLASKKFNSLTRHKNLASILGYNCVAQSVQERDEFTHNWTAFTYPSPEMLNDVLDQISPGEGLRFERHEGDQEINDEEFAEAFVRNKVLIAEASPAEIVSHAYFEPLGYIGLHGELLEFVKDKLSGVLERSRKIASAASVEDIDDLRVDDIAYPSGQIIEKARTGLEVTAVQTGSVMFKPDSYKRHLDKTYLISMYLNDLFFSRGLYDSNLVSILDLPEDTDFEQHAKSIERRYKKLNTAAGRLAVAS